VFALGVIFIEFLFGVWLDGQQRASIEITRFLGAQLSTAPDVTQQQQQQHGAQQLVQDQRCCSRLNQFIRQQRGYAHTTSMMAHNQTCTPLPTRIPPSSVEPVWSNGLVLARLDGGDEALDLAQRLTCHAPGDRLTAVQALAHPFLLSDSESD
jgi:serine/threonine protein kinase